MASDGQTPVFPYKTPVAFNAAVKQFLATAAAKHPYGINELRRQFAYDRLLTRIFAAEPDRWILKGGAGLLARLPGQARHSMDVDLFYRGEHRSALSSLYDVASAPGEDFFTFDINAGPTPEPGQSHQLAVTAYLGNTEFQRFKIDLVIASNMTQEPDTISPLTPLPIPGLRSQTYRVYSVVDHIADKLAAMVATYNGRPSSRYRDLVDLVLLANTQRPLARDLSAALLSELDHRELEVPQSVELPYPDWEAGYEAQLVKLPELRQRTAADGLVVVRALLDPILQGRTLGVWDPLATTWFDEQKRA